AGIDRQNKVEMGIRDNRYKAMVPRVIGKLEQKQRAHPWEGAFCRAHTKRKLKFTLPGPMTIIDTIADEFYGDRIKMAMAFADLLNAEARALEAEGVDIIQFDEPAFNAYTKQAGEWGIEALHRAIDGLKCKTAVHICYGYGIKANIDWKASLGEEWRQYEDFFPALAKSRIDQVSLECANSRVPPHLMALLDGKEVMVGVIDVATDRIETPEDIVATIKTALQYVPKNKLIPCSNCGLAPLDGAVAAAKLEALGKGAKLAREMFS
ncbi:MAG: methionine synthase, partial [Ferrovibrio sp.]